MGYQGWNQRYDEWITRGRIAENLTWNANPLKQKSGKSVTPPPEKQKVKSEKTDKCSEDDEKQDSEDKIASEEEKEIETKKKNKKAKSPAPKRANSPIVKEKTPTNKDKKKEITKRTNSPAQRKSPQLKRQSSRTSLFKQSDDDFEDISDIEEDDKIPRRSARGDKETIEGKAVTPKRSSRSGSNMKTDTKPEKVSETEEEEDEKKTEMAR